MDRQQESWWSCSIFRVLMWKHCVVRKRRFFQTLVEFFLPFCLILGMYLMKPAMQRKTGGSQLLMETFPVAKFSLDATEPPAGILYHPYNNATTKLMNEVTLSLNNMMVNATGDSKPHVRSLGFDNVAFAVEAMFLATSAIKRVYAMVEFEDMKGEDLPDVLNYTIRMASLVSMKPKLRHQRLFEKFENVPQTFLNLQWAIDTSFLKLKSDSQPLRQRVRFEPLSSLKPSLNKTYVSTVFYLLTYISFLAPMLTFVFLMNRLLEEKATGIHELIQMVGVTPRMLKTTHILNVMPTCLIYCIGGVILMKSSDTPMIPKTCWFLVFMNQFMHFLTVIAMAYACSNIFNSAQHTISISLFAYLGLWIPIRLMGSESRSDLFLFFHGLCPHCPVYWFLNEALVAEVRYETGVQIDTINNRFSVFPNGSRNGSVMVSYIMQVLQIIYFMTLAWYFEKVKPGKYGIAQPWNFVFQKEYWRKQKIAPMGEEKSAPYDPVDKKYFEEPPNMKVGIKIENVSKVFSSGKSEVKALSNVSLNIYAGEITVLLGHNGAGKTTLISIITGMIGQSSGNIFVEGMNTVTQQSQVRKRIGFCPQHNLFFPDLTVVEHLIFFCLIKGVSFEEAKIEAYELMDELDLLRHSQMKTTALSGGLLRRLQLGCALCGNASVLVLDEPTSGLDVEARRELWDMLLGLRGDRTLILTTHFMEEADVLGDRIAALHLGKLRCNATPMFLKKAVGSGYRINISMNDTADEGNITQALKKSVPDVILQEQSSKTLVYIVPAGADMVALFSLLESHKEDFGVDSYGVGITTLEEVFLELCCDVDSTTKSNVVGRQPELFKYVKGFRLLRRQVIELFKRQIDYTKANILAYLILHVIMPFALCTSLTQIFNILDEEESRDLLLNLDMYTETGLSDAVYSLRTTRHQKAITEIKGAYPSYTFKKLEDVPFIHTLYYADTIGTARDQWDKYMVGIALNDTDATVYYAPNLKHSAPVGLNLLSNILSIEMLGNAHGKSIITKLTDHWPALTKPYHIPKSKINCSLFAIFNICVLVATTLYDLTLPCKERLTVARHTHIMAGCSPMLYWLVTFFYHMLSYVCFCCTAVLIAAAFFDNDRTIDDQATLVAMFVVLILNGMNMYVFMYFISFCLSERIASLVLVSLFIIFGFLMPILIMAIEDLKTHEGETMFSKVSNRIGLLVPCFVFTKAMISITDTSRFNSFCSNNIQKCPNLVYFTEGFDKTLCCSKGTKEKGPFNHFAFSQFAAGKEVLATVLQFIFYSVLIFLLQYGRFNRWWNYTEKISKITFPSQKWHCPRVKEERAYVKDNIGQAKSSLPDTLLIHKLWKVYRNCSGRQTFAVKSASFSVKKGECFGLLGLNGAGKTTTYKLISTEESLTRGKISVNNNFVRKNKNYLSTLGYCPQFFGLDEFRSGAANLRTLLVLRGLGSEDVASETTAWLDVVGMTNYGHRLVSGYSGGMVRRLATAASLCGGSALTLLDEPTAGVDTAARRLVWAALKQGLRHNRAIVISSHCMDEMEHLCSRVTILSFGEMAVLGTPQELKEIYAPGHTIVIKLREFDEDQITDLNTSLNETFDCTIKDIHLSSVHYRINKKMLYSEIFFKMETVVSKHKDLIEDFTVAETSLEDVFLSFAMGPPKNDKKLKIARAQLPKEPIQEEPPEIIY